MAFKYPKNPYVRILICILAGFAGAVTTVMVQKLVGMPHSKMSTLLGAYAAAIIAWFWLRQKEQEQA